MERKGKTKKMKREIKYLWRHSHGGGGWKKSRLAWVRGVWRRVESGQRITRTSRRAPAHIHSVGFSSRPTVFSSHAAPAPASSHQPANSIFLSHHSSTSTANRVIVGSNTSGRAQRRKFGGAARFPKGKKHVVGNRLLESLLARARGD